MPRLKNKNKYSKKFLNSLDYKRAKKIFPKLKPNGDIDKDGVKNKKDCRPFNKKKHMAPWLSEQVDVETDALWLNPKQFKAFEVIKFTKEMGLSPQETIRELKNKKINDKDSRVGMEAYIQWRKGNPVYQGTSPFSHRHMHPSEYSYSSGGAW